MMPAKNSVIRRSSKSALRRACNFERLEQRVFLAANVPAGYVKLDTLSFNSVGTDTSDISLEPGIRYYLKSSSLWTGPYDLPLNVEYYDPSGSNLDTVPDVDKNEIDVGVKYPNQPRDDSMEPRWELVDGSSTVFINSNASPLIGTGGTIALGVVSEPGIFHPGGGSAHEVELWGPRPQGNAPAPDDVGGLTETEFGADGGLTGDENRSESGVRYSDGSVDVTATDLVSHGFGMDWGQTRAWSNRTQGNYDGPNGNGWVVPQRPYIMQVQGTDVIAVVTGGGSEHYFTKDGTNYWAGGFDTSKLNWNSVTDEFSYRDSTGRTIVFYDFDSSVAQARRGQFKSLTDAGENTAAVTEWTNDKPTEIQRFSGTGTDRKTESWLYSYVASGDNEGLVEKVTLRRGTGEPAGNWTTVREVVYAYYPSGDSNGLPRDLKSVTLYEGASTANKVIDKSYFRYYINGNAVSGYTGGYGYAHGLKLAFRPRSYARLAANVSSFESASDSTIEKYADHKLVYDSSKRVHTHVTQEKSSSSASSPGLGAFLFTYSTSGNLDDYNLWKYKVVETLPATTSGANGTNTVYLNAYGQTLLKAFQPNGSSSKWATYYNYDGSGRLLEKAEPSAVQTTADGTAVLIDDPTRFYTKASSGLIRFNTYATATTANESNAGDVAGYLKSEGVKRGRTDAFPSTLSEYTYLLHDNVDGSYLASNPQVRPLASVKLHKVKDDGGQTTNLAYTWYANSLQKKQQTTTYDKVALGENGPGDDTGDTADAEIRAYDLYNRETWFRNSEGSTDSSTAGYIQYTQYDNPTGAVVRSIVDVDASRDTNNNGSDEEGAGGQSFSDKPSGWSTRSGGGQHIRTEVGIDLLGRPTKIQTLAGTSPSDANDRVTRIVYKDTTHEKRVYPGFHDIGSDTYRTKGPIVVSREYRPVTGAGSGEKTVYSEELTTSANPGGGATPDGSETIDSSNIQSLSRTLTNDGNQVIGTDRYFSLANVTYSSATAQMGSASNDTGASGNRHSTTFGYNDRGWTNRRQDATGTITASNYDQLGRPTEKKIGTDDGGSSNMVSVELYEYDAGGVGDGNPTKLTRKPGGSATDRATVMAYDWRNRLVYRKEGAQSSESGSTGVQRPIFYTLYDNLDNVTEQRRYDGDDINADSPAPDTNPSDGVPDAPASSNLWTQTDILYDDRLRPYQTKVYSVSGSAPGSNLLRTDYFYDRRGNVVATVNPGGLTDKSVFDGAGRKVKTYATAWASPAWSTARGVNAPTDASDKVLTQTEYQYDKDSNVIFTIHKDRFHNASTTYPNNYGELGNKSTEPKARISYTESYFDKANRITDIVDVGTNGGTTFTRDASVPTRSNEKLVTSYAYGPGGWLETLSHPRERVTSTPITDNTFYDLIGRAIKTVENHIDGTPGAADDRTTEYTYDGNDHVLILKATLPSSTFQKTQYVYTKPGGATGSDIASNDLLWDIKYPKKTGTGEGEPDDNSKETLTYNALGERKTFSDRISTTRTVHTYAYDVVNRLTEDAVTTLGSGADGTVQRLVFTFDPAGRPEKFSSYNAASGGSVVNDVKREYNGLGQLTKEWQEHNGTVTGSSLKVQYTYPETITSNRSRLEKVSYANGRELHYRYASGIDSEISRITELASDSSGTTKFEVYSYLGFSTIVIAAHPQPAVDLTYAKLSGESDDNGSGTGGGDQYTGLDRFGFIIDQRWTTSGGSAKDRFKYGYDRDGNRLWRDNVQGDTGAATFDELYHADDADPMVAYDGLNRLVEFQRGTLGDGDGDGNKDIDGEARRQVWSLDALGNWGSFTTNTSTQTRTHNKQNQFTSISGQTTPTFDGNGNMTGDQTGNTLTYDAWNRLVGVSLANPLSYEYDALGRRIVQSELIISFFDEFSIDTEFYYNDRWQMIEERVDGAVKSQYVWSQRYVDAMVLRDRDADGNSGNGLEQRHYVQSDANFNVTALVNTSGAVQERYIYDPYGARTARNGDWSAISPPAHINGWYGFLYGHQGGRHDAGTGLMNFRNRYYSTGLGRWVQQDPKGYVDGLNLYGYERDNPLNGLDPSGHGLLKWLYTSRWNATDEEYDAAVQAAGEWQYETSPVRGGYIGVGVKKDQERGAGNAGGEARWTMDDGIEYRVKRNWFDGYGDAQTQVVVDNEGNVRLEPLTVGVSGGGGAISVNPATGKGNLGVSIGMSDKLTLQAGLHLDFKKFNSTFFSDLWRSITP